MAAYVLTAAAMSLPALGMLRCCCRRRVSTTSLAMRSSSALIIDTDCALDDLATLAMAAATDTPLHLVTTVNGLASPGHGHLLIRSVLDALELRSVPVVAGAEEPPSYVVREKADWELGYGDRLANAVAQLGIEPVTQPGQPGTAAAAADAIIESARAAGGATVLALGALTNLAAACERHPVEFCRSIDRVIFIADAQPARPSFNVQCDPQALATVMQPVDWTAPSWWGLHDARHSVLPRQPGTHGFGLGLCTTEQLLGHPDLSRPDHSGSRLYGAAIGLCRSPCQGLCQGPCQGPCQSVCHIPCQSRARCALEPPGAALRRRACAGRRAVLPAAGVGRVALLGRRWLEQQRVP